jgi:tungstate transport system substrate-binding protein
MESMRAVPSAKLLLVVLAVVTLVGCRSQSTNYLDIATTTSVYNSGLLEALLPHFQPATVRVHPVGSGLALKMLADGTVDFVISHAPETETRYLAQHPEWQYRKLAFNHFLVVGPREDPAHVREAQDVTEAFKRMAARGAPFVSRGDQSGTHEREQSLWKAAGVAPSADRLLVSGSSMGVTLRQANERQAYTLSDDSTFWQLEARLNLVVLVEGDALLVNTYAAVFLPRKPTAASFADWLTRGDGRQRIADYRVQGRSAFTVWPLACPSNAPDAQPCGTRR